MKGEVPGQAGTEPPVERPENSQTPEPLLSAAGTAERIKTAQKHLTAAGIAGNLAEIQNKIRARSLFYRAISVGAGFVVGGAMASKLGLALIGMAARKLAAETATKFGRQIFREAGAASA